MKTKPIQKLYAVHISAIEDDIEGSCSCKNVIARTAPEAASRVRLANRKDHVEFIQAVEWLADIDKL